MTLRPNLVMPINITITLTLPRINFWEEKERAPAARPSLGEVVRMAVLASRLIAIQIPTH